MSTTSQHLHSSGKAELGRRRWPRGLKGRSHGAIYLYRQHFSDLSCIVAGWKKTSLQKKLSPPSFKDSKPKTCSTSIQMTSSANRLPSAQHPSQRLLLERQMRPPRIHWTNLWSFSRKATCRLLQQLWQRRATVPARLIRSPSLQHQRKLSQWPRRSSRAQRIYWACSKRMDVVSLAGTILSTNMISIEHCKSLDT